MTRGVFLIAGIFFGIVAVALLASVEIEAENVDCGIAPVAAIHHDTPGCESEGRNQTFGAAAAGAVAALFLFGSRAAQAWAKPIRPGDVVDGPPALDNAALEELRRYRRRAWVLTAAGMALFTAFLIAVTNLYDDAEKLERVGVRVPGLWNPSGGAASGVRCGCRSNTRGPRVVRPSTSTPRALGMKSGSR